MISYSFQYAKQTASLIVALLCLVVSSAAIFLGVSLHLQDSIILTLAVLSPALLFFALRKKTFGNCIAKLDDTHVEFHFEMDVSTIEYSSLSAFEVYYGKNATVLHLNCVDASFSLYANGFCNRSRFDVFCKALSVSLDNYKVSQNPLLIHKGSIFATRAMVIFLVIVTVIYLLSFLVESPKMQRTVGVAGGFALFILWMAYASKKDMKTR